MNLDPILDRLSFLSNEEFVQQKKIKKPTGRAKTHKHRHSDGELKASLNQVNNILENESTYL